ncbi:protein-disulfide reductase DsbD N-terminal domain-containing protein [Methylomonas sp. LL1]|uniref:protein-disulfide reductase DsbD domain-containing protein n=1 Tax=Methylomonas sp. LL1 TaxID=2785785 RepID=UPI0018C35A97|nr:protein-disulfide reductase DsbD domain-containing protein [Methylomonas sp. LL1]QPK63691.1 protein-disulfide reductase DsbD N-terminal domain-containing protein [Methylomonas sp. LL1]
MRSPFVSRPWLLVVFMFAVNPALLLAGEQTLESEQAFELSADLKDAETVRLSWNIADGYYLYRQKFKFVSLTPGPRLGEPLFPVGQSRQDKSLGLVEVYRESLELELPIRPPAAKAEPLSLEVTFQGCADAGFCYMPVKKVITLDLSD